VGLFLLEGDILVGLELVASVISPWKIVKMSKLFLSGACELVVEHAIFGVEEKLSIMKGLLSFVELAWRRR
jgi:hypothetical protein